MNIYTLTLNPAYDVHASCDNFLACRENYIKVDRRDAGGKGINISRALQNAGIPYSALVVLGRENSVEFEDQLAAFGLKAMYFAVEGRIRENLTIHHGDRETRISYPGFRVDESVLEEISASIKCEDDTVLTFTGSIPDGISKQQAKNFLIDLKKSGVKIVLDCRSFDLQDIRDIAPWLIKPNQQEASAWFGRDISSIQDAAWCARKLHDMGVENAIVSMGEKGAVLACGQVYLARVPEIRSVSTIGAGDSSIAGFLAAASNNCSKADCLGMAVVYGTAACLTQGSEPPRMYDIIKISSEVSVKEV